MIIESSCSKIVKLLSNYSETSFQIFTTYKSIQSEVICKISKLSDTNWLRALSWTWFREKQIDSRLVICTHGCGTVTWKSFRVKNSRVPWKLTVKRPFRIHSIFFEKTRNNEKTKKRNYYYIALWNIWKTNKPVCKLYLI